MFLANKLNKGAGAPTPVDPQFNYVTMLLHGDGTNGGQNNTFLDASTNNFTITRNGNTTQGSFSPYGPNWSNFFDGSGDYLQVSGGTPLTFGTGNFTIEGWVYPTTAATQGVFQVSSTGLSIAFSTTIAVVVESSGWSIYTGSGVVYSTVVPTFNAWSHFAYVRNSGTITLYVNGVSVITKADTTNYTFSTMAIGGVYDTDYLLTGYISNLRVVKGTALYTSAFTPSTTPLTAIANTQLLTCQSNRFIDNSTNNFAITVNGNTSVQRFSPFAPPAAYNPATIGGSGYFDQTDYLTPPSNSAFAFGTGDFTVEGWFYDSGSLRGTLLYQSGSANTSGSLWVGWYGSPTLYFRIDGLSNDITATVNCPRYQWFHFAATRQSGTVRVFVNGAQVLTGTRAQNITQQSPLIGYEPAGGSYNLGYTASYRVVKGTAVYTANFTPPTAPVTAITNTELLCNFTNAAIFDNAMMNDLETVGNAQISTSVVKYGTGSISTPTSGYLINTDAKTNLGSANFTVEFWVNSASDEGGYPGLVAIDSGLTGDFAGLVVTKSGVFVSYNGSSWAIFAASMGTVSDGAWRHIAVVRNGSSLLCFNNGVLQSTTSITSAIFYKGPATIVGKKADNFTAGEAYIDDLRITKGVARYTATFTPPTAAFPNL
jgi:hypothetical protein